MLVASFSDAPGDGGRRLLGLRWSVMGDAWRERVRSLKRDTLALYLAARHPRTPWYAKLVVAVVAAYALSPIDLIPDFVPVLGYLDDLLLLPLGIALAVRLVPADVLQDFRMRAAEAFASGRPVSRTGAAAIVVMWLAAFMIGGVFVAQLFSER